MSVSACPNCGNAITVPYPGMKAGKFAGLYFGSWFAYAMIVGMAGGSEVAFPLIPVWFAFKLWLGYQRAVNIGWSGYAAAWVLLPFIGALVLACHKTGEGMKRVKV